MFVIKRKQSPDLDYYAGELEKAMQDAKVLMAKREYGEKIPDFDIRGSLYNIALELEPNARNGDIEMMRRWIAPATGEVFVDIAAGTGFLTKPIAQLTKNTTYAIDPSKEQLTIL